MNILCASQASTAVRSSRDQASASSLQTTTIRDSKRFGKTLPSNLCTSQPPPFNPLPYHQLKNNEKRSSNNEVSANSNDLIKKNSSLKPTDAITRKSSCSDIKDADTGDKQIQSVQQDQHQVVVLKVSLHCKGCEGKVRKHLSRMEGVTSFSIDSAAKKVTIVGDVTPSQVLASVSRVKTAQFWTSAVASTNKMITK
ncbi:hypothetical protein F3Y22_tig00014862pilonHSYRG00013 [Hibiscus syriacus]|uniref:HMA domain-containing protein n=2 Tax=Hibiscus syriacus TaxID=106335 RepID=A0A6A3C3T0_HIBSY|nr:hypothetical protein F3Y22_tig00014862pilonHSYRG00013 [Hibiscus syriacus]